ncbi:hypothetical protein Pint_13614 [Pistacia integerrima]|uniref:Uncharacterized protein n=1 Tax=Pistacia integerrima TaxID=434235 RepID=A0ACC0Y9N3_9ROSI|nr:hypothetical protein Pint_13614 [Pistacia integerrima]
MLCLKAEVLDEQDCLQHNQPSSPSTINNSGFLLPINLGSSIHRYLWKKGWSFSAGDGSLCPSDFEVSKLPNKTRGEKCLYKYQLEQDIKKLRQQLQEEIDLHLALASAVEHSDPTLSNSPCQLPDKAQDLLDSIAVLEITVSKLEQETVSLQYQLSQERNERRLAEYRLSHTSSTELSSFDSSQAHLPQLITRPHCEKSVEGEMKEMQALPNSIEEQNYNDSGDNLWHYPCRLSEEMNHPLLQGVPQLIWKMIPDIFARDRSFDPYGFPRKVDWTRNIGNYSMAVEVSWLSVGKKELEYAATALKRFRLFLEHLARVDLYCMTCNEKLAFWINLYNALIMHAYLAYGVPTSEMKLFSLIQKAAYTVGGHSFTAADIEFIILKMKPPAHRPQIALVLALQKFKASEELKKYSIDHHEPLLPFALSSGMHSSPAVRIYQPENVTELLKESLRDYVQASVGISSKGKLLVPKLLHCFAKGLVEDSSLPDWICQFLSEEHAAMVRKCSCHQKWRLPGARSFSVLPFDSRFRYLFLMEDGDCNSFASEM